MAFLSVENEIPSVVAILCWTEKIEACKNLCWLQKRVTMDQNLITEDKKLSISLLCLSWILV